MMLKIIDPAGWSWDRPVAQMIKVSSRGLIGNDRTDFIKSAGHVFADILDNIKVAKDEVPVHLLALGASEAYGANRNGDGFKEADCRTHHKTFEKSARWYRNHQNKDPEKSYGYIKASAYSETMRRVELLPMLNASKEAAERNGGFVADDELQKLAKGEDIPVSMACKIAFDVCSGCGNKARTRAEYCTDKTCKYGGCKDNLTKVAYDGHLLHVDNPNPLWFDISNVFRPADRIAYGTKADYLEKAASHTFMPGAAMADALGLTLPLHVLASTSDDYQSAAVEGQIKIAYAMATLEATGSVSNLDKSAAACVTRIDNETLQLMGSPGSEKFAQALSALAQRTIVLPLADFAAWVGKSASVSQASSLLPGIYSRMISDTKLEQKVAGSPFNARSTKIASAELRRRLDGYMPSHSFEPKIVTDRVITSSWSAQPAWKDKSGFCNEKQAAAGTEARQLAEAYALYKLAAVYRLAETSESFGSIARLALVQNSVE
jgi:hypothetical protein